MRAFCIVNFALCAFTLAGTAFPQHDFDQRAREVVGKMTPEDRVRLP